jgi:hypothetical protein
MFFFKKWLLCCYTLVISFLAEGRRERALIRVNIELMSYLSQRLKSLLMRSCSVREISGREEYSGEVAGHEVSVA